MAKQTRVLGVRSRGRPARYRAARARRHQPGLSALLQAREGDRVPRHGGDAADRQFRLDARPADHRGGDERRHPGAHARALRRQGRDPGLHHARLEGRPVARALDRRRQAAQSRPAQRSAPHHLQAGRRAVAARAQEPRPDAARGHPQGEHRRRGAALGAQPPARAHRAAPHPDGDLRRRAGRRFDALGQSRQLSRAPSARGHRARSSATRRSSSSPSASATTSRAITAAPSPSSMPSSWAAPCSKSSPSCSTRTKTRTPSPAWRPASSFEIARSPRSAR